MSSLDIYDNKRILIWGYGREGRSTEAFLKGHCSPACIDVFEGERDGIDESRYDLIIKSPGIVMDEDNDKYTSQTQIFLEHFRNNTIGITGTKGKSTTSALMHHVLSAAGKKTILLGNIGKPCLDYYDEIDKDTIVVFEMSCHQLAHVTVSPHIAVFLNLYEEHLDYYKTLDRYFAAKERITKFQKSGDHLYVGENVPAIDTAASVSLIRAADAPSFDLRILGHHNDLNAYFVYRIATELFDVKDPLIRRALSEFAPLPHRLQFIGSRDGIDFYDDSISTIPSATIEALEAVPNAGTVLIGGMDRGISYDTLIDFVNKHGEYKYIFSYDSGKRIFDSINKTPNCMYEQDLKAAVQKALSVTPPGYAVILSPASASYGYFKNFEERGDVFCGLCGLEAQH